MKIEVEFGERLPTLDAGRVRLRWLTEEDVPALFGIFGNKEVTRYFGLNTLPDLAAAAALLAQIHRGFNSRSIFQWGVELDGGPLVGTCTLHKLDFRNRRAELGFALGQEYWGHGYIAAALPVVLEFGFGTLGLHRLVADPDPRNARSIRALERLGFQREGLLREHYLTPDEVQDAVVYGLLKAEWADGSRAAAEKHRAKQG